MTNPSVIFLHLRAHRLEVGGQARSRSVSLTRNSAALRMTVCPTGQRAQHGEDRDFVDDVGNLPPFDHRAVQPRALHLDRAGRFDLLDVLDDLVDVRAHAQQHGEHARARVVEADVLDQQPRARLRRRRRQPERRAGDVPRHREIARFRHLPALMSAGSAPLRPGAVPPAGC